VSYSKPEQVCPRERGGYKKFLKRKRTKAARRIARTREDGGRIRVPMYGYST